MPGTVSPFSLFAVPPKCFDTNPFFIVKYIAALHCGAAVCTAARALRQQTAAPVRNMAQTERFYAIPI